MLALLLFHLLGCLAQVVVLFRSTGRLFGRLTDLTRTHRVIALAKCLSHIEQLVDVISLLLATVIVRCVAVVVAIVSASVVASIRRKTLVHDSVLELLGQNTCVSSAVMSY